MAPTEKLPGLWNHIMTGPGPKVMFGIGVLFFLLSVQIVSVEGVGVRENCNSSVPCDSGLICDSDDTCKQTPQKECTLDDDCQTGLTCRDRSNKTYCLCQQTEFWYQQDSSCQSVNSLVVTNVQTDKTTDSVTLTWTSNKYGLDVKYGLVWESEQREDEVASPKVKSGLGPGIEYSYALVAYLVADTYYDERSVQYDGTVTTIKTNEQGCDSNSECQNGLTCRDRSGTKYCLCAEDGFWYQQNSSCLSVNSLVVTNVQTDKTTDSVTLTWTSNKYGLDVKYGLVWESEQREDEVTSPKVKTGLGPGIEYSYALVAYLVADTYYDERSVQYDGTVTTIKTHEQECDSNSECQNGLTCRDRSGTKYCLCAEDGFWYQQNSSCLSVNSLVVTNVQTDKTTDSVTLTWTSNKYGLDVKYGLVWESEQREDEVASPKVKTGLGPGIEYSYALVAYLVADTYYDERSVQYDGTVTTIKTHEQGCDSNSECQNGLTCRDRSGTKYCLCAEDGFWYQQNSSCLSVNSLVVTNVQTDKTTDSVTLTWTSNKYGLDVKYGLVWESEQREDEVASPKVKTGLGPGIEYSYALVAYLVADTYYDERSVQYDGTVTTIKTNEQGCDSNSECQNGLTCRDRSGTKYCLCAEDGFWYQQNSSCLSVNSLVVTNVQTDKTTDSVTLTWTSNKYGLDVKYGLVWESEQREDEVTSPKVKSGLGPGIEYSYALVAYLVADTYYDERSVQYDGTVTTIKTHEQGCDSNSECQNGLTCRDRSGTKYCLCAEDGFWYQQNSSCLSVNSLVVTNVQTDKTTDSVTLTWTSNKYGLDVKYGLVWESEQREDEVTSPKVKSGLGPGIEYSYALVAYLVADTYYDERSVQYDGTVTTIKTHEQGCDSNSECQNGLTCRDRSGTKYCLCAEDGFWYQQNSSCLSVNSLVVTNVQTDKRTDSVTLTWTSNKYGLDVKYGLVWESEQREDEVASPKVKSGLGPGIEYSYALVAYLVADTYYDERSVQYDGTVTTNPDQPGPVNRDVSQLSINPMEIVFGAAEGASYYTVEISPSEGGDSENKRTSTNTVKFNLQNAVKYDYTITAYNTKDDAGVPRTGDLTTNAAPSTPVTNLTLENITATNVTLSWTMPVDPKGSITDFFVQVFDGDTMDCIQIYILACSDCKRNLPRTVPSQCQNLTESTGSNFTAKDVEGNSSQVFNQQITCLSPFTSYKVNVYAFNDFGKGEDNEMDFTTLEDRPNDIKSIDVDPGRDGQALQVYLNVILTPGTQTGVTNFTVTLINDQDGSDVKTEILTGYSSTTVTFTDLLAYHNYRVTAYAETSVGKSPAVIESNTVKTLDNKPGKAKIQEIQTDSAIATKFTMTLDCPSQNERNGTVQSASVRKTTHTTPARNEIFNFSMPSSCSLTLKSDNLGTFTVSQNYSFSVTVENQNFTSDPSETVNFFASPKPPIFKEDKNNPLVGSPQKEVTSETSIQVKVNAAGLTDRSQGEITIAGLIVCVDPEQNSCLRRTKRATKDSDYYQSYTTWAQSEARDFQISYRATPEDWLQDNPNDLYTIGSDSKCQKGVDVQTYCNGPLPSGQQIVVTAFSCTSGGCSEGISYETKTKASDSSDNAGLIAGIVVAVVVLLVIAVLLAVFILRRRKRKPRRMEPHVLPDYPAVESRSIPIRNFKETVKRYHKDSDLLFHGQFEDIKTLSSQVKATTHEAQKEENRVKNRYVDILPYDHSRVKLQVQDDSEDYINANFIQGFNSPREYIATQGPMHATIPHFWRMVWERKSTVIVMLSDLTESNKLKVSLYWPENLNEPISYGEVLVEMTNFSQLNKYIIRNFRISFGEQSRRVTHFFIPGWWDFSANLTFSDVLEFCQLVRQEATPPNSGPIVVHCSAGVGRTGTFIALDYFIQYINKKSLDDDMDIFSFVMSMRKDRPRMVQAEAQYIFIFDALVEVIERKLKEEQEHLYDNSPDHIYKNVDLSEENIYVNTANGAEDHTYSNQAFVGDGDGSPSKPTTVL